MTEENEVTTDEVTENEGSDEPKTFDQSYVKELREEAKSYRKKLAAIKEENEKLTNEKLSDTEKREKRIKDLEKALEDKEAEIFSTKTTSLITKALIGKPIVDSDTAMMLIQKELDGEEDIDEKVVSKAVDTVLKAKPYLTASEPKAGAGNFGKTDKEPAKNPDEMMGEFLTGQ